MGSHMNFKNYGDNNPIGDGSSGKPPPNIALVRQPSIYSLTFDEFQNTMGGIGKDFGSMNMDELLKNIWTAEETQAMTFSSAGGEHSSDPGTNLQRQGSLTLPRTVSQKTVDEVWRDLIKDNGGAKDGNSTGGSNPKMPQRQQTLGEMTLEEFLFRAGVVREDMPIPQQVGRANGNNAWLGDYSQANNNSGLVLGFQQPNRSNGNLGSNNTVSKQNPSLSLNVNAQQQAQQKQQQQPPLFPKLANIAFAPSMHLLNNAQLAASSGARAGMIGVAEHSMNAGLVQSSALTGVGMVGLAATAAGGSPASQISPDVITKSSADTSSLSPVPYVINRGRKCSAIEKVVERRQRRMIKNRESAARSRARKQAYTLELEAEVAKLKEINQELQRKQSEIMEMQKNQVLETMNRSSGGKRRCLRRTLTGPW